MPRPSVILADTVKLDSKPVADLSLAFRPVLDEAEVEDWVIAKVFAVDPLTVLDL